VSRNLTRAAWITLLFFSGLSCEIKGTDYFIDPSVLTGNLTGTVSSGGTPISGASVALTGVETLTTTTAATGIYNFLGLAPGAYNVTATSTGVDCPSVAAQITAVQTTTVNLSCTPKFGSISGNITLDLTPTANVLVTAKQGSTTSGSGTSGANGIYTIGNLAPGNYTAIVTPKVGTFCATSEKTATVQSSQVTTVDFSCQTLGKVGGTVRVNGAGQGGIVVSVTQGGSAVGTATTANDGTYTVSNLLPGSTSVSIPTPAGTSCTTNPLTVTVAANSTATANFDCNNIPSNEFSVTLEDPGPSYRHIAAGSSEVCTGFSTNPAKPGASYTATWTGAGTTGGTTRTGMLNSLGKGMDRQPIFQLGVFSVNITIVANSVSKSATSSVTVQAAQGTCPP
jgi:hypothetical protein